jgi:hypothetical protein
MKGVHSPKAGSSGEQPLSHSRPRHISFLSPSRPPALQQQPTPAYSIQSIATSASTTSVFFFPVSTTILDLTISEFISWTTNLRKQLHKNLKYYT